MGDTIIRGVDSMICTREKDSHTVCCLPGAQVGDILERMDKLLARAGRDRVVKVHVRTNDIDKGRFEVLQDKFVQLAHYLHSSLLWDSTCTTCKQRESELYLEV